MNIVYERTRLIFSEYNDLEKRKIDNLVATMDKVFSHEDIDKRIIYLPTGMIKATKSLFPKNPIVDHSKEHWSYANIQPVKHSAEPRNQLQVDFIDFGLQAAEKKQKFAGILSPGTGKALPNSIMIPTPSGWKRFGDLKVGDYVFDENGQPTRVCGVFPQGMKKVWEIGFSEQPDTLDDSSDIIRQARCCIDHLWRVTIWNEAGIYSYNELCTTDELIDYRLNEYEITIDTHNGEVLGHREYHDYLRIESIMDLNCLEEMTCIKVENPTELFLTEDYIVTHNTFMACYMALKMGVRTLIIVPTSGIKAQWVETLVKMFQVPEERVLSVDSPQAFVGIKADFAVVSHASLAVLNKKYDLEAIMKSNKFGFKIIDEVQMWFHNIIKIDGSSNICHNLYLTGTFGRSGDEENELYQEMFHDLAIFREKDKNPTLFDRKPGNVYGMKPHMNVNMMWTASDLSAEEIKKVSSTMRYSERSGKWQRYGISIAAYTKLVIPPDGRMTKFLGKILKVVQLANTQVTYGKMLVLTPTIDSVEILAKHIQKLYPDKKIGTIHSRNGKEHNDRVKEECEIMISTVKSSGTGFDVKDLAKLVVAEQFKSWILADQVSGRLRRRPDEKETHMWDIVDSTVPQLRAWANARANVLKKKSKVFKVIDI